MNMKELLTPPKTIAIVGLSDKPDRPSYEVGLYLKNQGFTIIPVNPNIKTVFGLSAYPSISAIPTEIRIDIVDIFRKPEQVIPILQEVVHSGRKPFIWMQEGVGSVEAKNFADAHALESVMDMCMMKTHLTIYKGETYGSS